ncbi:MAG: thioredoxin 1, partial [Paracoccaceae bacterium]
VRVDWDIHAGSDISTRYNIPRRSTLLLLRGDDELGRIVAGTSTKTITALMDLGLATA